MPIYRVECVNRQTGVPYPVLIEALKPDDAAEYCSAQGHLVGRVLQERDLPVGTRLPGSENAAAPVPVKVSDLGPKSKDQSSRRDPPSGAVSLGVGPFSSTSSPGNGFRAAAPPQSPSPQTPLAPTAALTLEESQTLREIADHLAALRRAPIVARPRRTIAAGVLLGLGVLSVVGMILAVVLTILGVAGLSQVIAPSATRGLTIDDAEVQQPRQVLGGR